MIGKLKSWSLRKFNQLKHKRWFQIFAGLFIVRWAIRLAVLAYLGWMMLPAFEWYQILTGPSMDQCMGMC